MTRRSEAFLTGGSGLVGGHLLGRLVETGWRVDALVRSQNAADTVMGLGATPVRGDLLDRGGLSSLMQGARTVFHVAGVNDTCPRDAGSMDRVNVDGTRAVIAAAASAGVERVVYTSSAAVIGEAAGTVGREDTPHTGSFLSPYARSKYLAEVGAFGEAARRGVDLVVVNPSSVQGPGRATGSAEILVRVMNSNRPILVNTHVSIVDIEDCTEGHIQAATRGIAGERYLLSAEAVTVVEAVSVIPGLVGRPVRPRWIAPGVVRAVGIPLAWVAGKVKPDAGFCPSLLRTLLHGHRFDATKAVRELGLTFTPAVETLERTAEWLIAAGYVNT